MVHFSPLLLLAVLLPGAEVGRASAPTSFAYVLQADAEHRTRAAALHLLADSGRDWLVMDGSYDGSLGSAWTKEEIDAVRAAKPGRKMLAYLSIGEAEEYRPYWDLQWGMHKSGGLTAQAPSFLIGENPDWPGNYRVKYWDPAWQKIILAQIDALMARGFDGLYLDIVDGYETFEKEGNDWIDDRPNPATKRTYRLDMITWVQAIAARARASRPGALIIPQNGAPLLTHADFVQTVDGIGLEDTFYNGNRPQRPADTKYVLSFLDPLVAAGKPILLIEYVRKPELWPALKKEAARPDFCLLITDRQLKTLGQSSP